jgi:hypothetical protein
MKENQQEEIGKKIIFEEKESKNVSKLTLKSHKPYLSPPKNPDRC